MSHPIAIQLASPLQTGQAVPLSGQQSIPLSLDFSASTEYDLFLQQSGSVANFGMIQALFFDASNVTGILNIFCPVSNQLVILDPLTQGFRTLLCPNPAQLSFLAKQNRAGVFATGILQVNLLNYPVSNDWWSV